MGYSLLQLDESREFESNVTMLNLLRDTLRVTYLEW